MRRSGGDGRVGYAVDDDTMDTEADGWSRRRARQGPLGRRGGMPSGPARDRETACRALSALSPLQVKQDGSTRKGVGHVSAFAFLEIQLPCRMVWVCGTLYLGAQMKRQGGCVE